MKNVLILILILAAGFGGIFLIVGSLEKSKPEVDKTVADEDLYFSAEKLSLLGADFKGLIADWYWINSLQYIGNKVIDVEGGAVDIGDLRPLNPRLLYPMLDTASTLDPQFMTVYSYGAAILPAIDAGQAVKLMEKGIAANPDEWRLYQNLGYIHWQSKNYQKAAEVYAAGAQKKDAPVWMYQMSVNMRAQGASRDFAKQIYLQMYENAQDEQTKTFAELRFAQIQSLDERDAIRAALQDFSARNKRCVNSWAEISRELRAVRLAGKIPLNFNNTATPTDPTGSPYSLLNQNGECEVGLANDSKIPRL